MSYHIIHLFDIKCLCVDIAEGKNGLISVFFSKVAAFKNNHESYLRFSKVEAVAIAFFILL